ncbi:hypothetical protein [Colwellia piezophila]|uniref:hypothetical protein n=1 Tax=Colwellia piezophila TaxID=211668 RepID=UPI00037488E4|nr:hypothetical protein [Colwellia piezophila]
MNEKQFNTIKYALISLVIILELGHLSWEYFNGGVLSHHLLNRADLPSISNWWGLIIIPLLAWFTTTRVKKRIILPHHDLAISAKIKNGILIGFTGMLIISIIQSLAFTFGYQHITMYLALGLLITGLFIPIYRAECILGNVLGAVFIFGPVIPFIGILVMAPVSAFSHLCLKPLILRLVKGKASST